MDFQKFYDLQPDYETFRNDPKSREEYSVIADWKIRNLLKCLPENFKAANILEVGCAFGYILNNISRILNISNKTGIDISGNNIDAAKTFYPDCNYFRGTLEEYILSGAVHFDLIVLSDIVEHISDDVGFMKSIAGVSEYTLLNLPLEKSFANRNRKYGEDDPSGHLRCYDEADAVKLVKAAGYEIINSFTSVAFFDKAYRNIYRKRRAARLMKKSLPKMIFWSSFYFAQDRFKLMSEAMTRQMIGTNYFALLAKSNGKLRL
jgi:SAM-dependent methyltransferase